jgi:hypothetical protein
MSEVLSQEWRVEHCAKGDEALAAAVANVPPGGSLGVEQAMAGATLVAAYAAIAQAHYAAANVRARLTAPKMTVVPEGVHVRVDGWCSQCGGTGELETPHVDISS